MILFIKDRKTFKTIAKAYPQGWEVPILASTHEKGTIIIPLEDRKNFSGDIVFFDNYLFLVDESAPNDGVIELTVSDLVNMFSREIFYPDSFEGTSYGDFIEQAIIDNFINCEDPEYRIDYLEINNIDITTFEPPANIPDTRLFSLVDVITTAREKGVLFNFYIFGNKLILDISSPITVPHNIVFGDGHSVLETETFSRVKTSKITVLQETGTSGVYNSTTWYMSKSGDISDTVPEDRAEGDWIYIRIGQNDVPRDKASDEFKKNISSHKIEFYSDRSYYLWDTVNFTIDGELMTSSIISVILSSDNKRYLYKCGDLATTLTEKVQKIS